MGPWLRRAPAYQEHLEQGLRGPRAVARADVDRWGGVDRAASRRDPGREVFLAVDSPDATWPLLLLRFLRLSPSDSIDEVLERDLDADAGVDPLFQAPEIKRLLRLVLNAILYTTSAQLDPILLPPRPERGRSRSTAPGQRPPRSAEGVHYLPGRIDVAKVRRLRELERSEPGQQLMRRFLVRGHWRRASPSWSNQRLRWIEPYWKGPTLGEVIEREYRLRP